MSFRVTNAFALATEADRLTQLLSKKSIHSKEDGSIRTWEDDEFIAWLAEIGVVYKTSQLSVLKAELVKRGVIQ